MGSSGSRGPRPYAKRQTSTVFARVPRAEWAAVKIGVKREFRAGCGKHSPLWSVQTPTPAVAYTVNTWGIYSSALMVLEDVWREPLGAISPDSLAAEGFESIAAFRHHWIDREHRCFPPLRMTTVYRMRQWTVDDNREMADAVLRRLYGEFLPSATARGPDPSRGIGVSLSETGVIARVARSGAAANSPAETPMPRRCTTA